MQTRLLAAPLALLCTVLTTASVNAAVEFGTDVKITYDETSPFGVMNVVGNSFTFNPSTFAAQSLNGAGAVTTNHTLVINIEVTNPGFALTGFALSEEGDYNGTGGTVQALGELLITSQTSLNSDNELFDTGLLAPLPANQAWNVSASVDLANTPGWGSDTEVNVSLENVLNATTVLLSGTNAFIEKKLVTVQVFGTQSSPVPVPAAAWLFGSALLGLAGMRSKNR